MKLDSWEWDHICNIGNVTANGKYLEEVDTMGSKEDTLQSTLNKGDPKQGCYQTIFYGVVSMDTVMVRRYGTISWIFGEPKKVNALWCFQFQRV